MSPELKRDARVLSNKLAVIRDRWRTSRVVTGLATFAGAAALGVLLLTGAEALLHFPGGVRWTLLAVSLGALAAGLGLLVARPMVERISLERVARLVEIRRPELGNLLIGGLQLARAGAPAPAAALAGAALNQAAAGCARLKPHITVDREKLRFRAMLAGLCCLPLVAAFAFFPARMSSALKRLVMPGSFVPRVGSVRIYDDEIRPGDAVVLAGSDVTFQARIEPVGGDRHPAGRVFYREEGGPEFSRRMESGDGENYVYVLRNIERGLRYRVEVGDSQTRYYTLKVVERPEVRRVDLEYRYPKYTGRAPESFTDVSNREIRVPAGTRVRITARTNRRVESGYLDFGNGASRKLEVSELGLTAAFTVEKSGSYAVVVQDADGHRNLNPPRYPIVALADAPPTVRITAPGRNLKLPVGGKLSVAIWATDDYGMKDLTLVFRRNRGGELQKLGEWRGFPDPRKVQAARSWTLSSRDFDPGDVVFYYAEASDRVQSGRSPTFEVTLIDPKAAHAQRLKDLAGFIAKLKKILAQQQSARAGAGALFKKPPVAAQLLAGCKLLAAQQAVIRRSTVAAADAAPLEDALARKVRSAVLMLAAGPELQAERAAATLAASAATAKQKAGQVLLITNQDIVIKRLKELLQVMEKLEAQATKEDDEDPSDLPDDAREALKNLAEKLKEFMDEQKKLIEATQELAKIPVEDLTEEDKKKVKALAATEDKWEKFLKDAHSDLSKLQKQDFTDPKLLKELIETYSEVEMAKDALTKKSAEIAVPLEQAGLESAEALTTHLEKWLPDTPDRDKWKMEEPLTENQTPMAELPKELEDLIGDLMEEQEDVFEEMEDTTSSWTDSLDKGAGWDAMDGPISNMSAQGVTGNRLPNSSEISGRSGEGRTGKAAGEFVEKTATGKGGRKTPTRLTPDQFLKGQIDDKSKDPAGGSTGGGKVGGSGGEGLEGPPPPETKAEVGRLAGKQAQILSRAERIRLELKLRNHPTADIDRVIAMMKGVRSDIKDGRYKNISRKRNVLLKGLKTTRDFAAASSRVQKENSRALPKRLRDELFDAMDGGVPAGYEELVKRYYESISREGKQPQE